jgi:protein-disulfide isomerase
VAQKNRARQGSNLKPFYWVLGVLAIAGIAVIAWLVVRTQTQRAAVEPVEVAAARDPQALVALARGVGIGSDDAPVKMLVFSDFQCPACAHFASQMEPLITSEFVQPGSLQFVYYDFPLGGNHRYSFLASRAARCAGDQNKFWEYHNLLFGKQSDWSPESKPPVGKLIGYGNELGLDRTVFEPCVRSDRYQDIVSANRLLGEQLGVNATPTVFVNAKRITAEVAMDIKALRQLINAELAAAGSPPATTTE